MKQLAKTVCWTLVFLLGTLALVSLIAAPFVGMWYFSKQVRYDFAMALTSQERHAPPEAQQPVAAMYFPEPAPPPEPEPPTFADEIGVVLRALHAQPAEQQRVANVFRDAAQGIQDTRISTDMELTKYLGVTAAQELGDSFEHWTPFFNYFAETLSELKLQGQLADNDMQSLGEICSETARLLGAP